MVTIRFESDFYLKKMKFNEIEGRKLFRFIKLSLIVIW